MFYKKARIIYPVIHQKYKGEAFVDFEIVGLFSDRSRKLGKDLFYSRPVGLLDDNGEDLIIAVVARFSKGDKSGYGQILGLFTEEDMGDAMHLYMLGTELIRTRDKNKFFQSFYGFMIPRFEDYGEFFDNRAHFLDKDDSLDAIEIHTYILDEKMSGQIEESYW